MQIIFSLSDCIFFFLISGNKNIILQLPIIYINKKILSADFLIKCLFKPNLKITTAKNNSHNL